MRKTPDKLEQFVASNRQQFDIYQPPASLRSRVILASAAGRRFIFRKRLMLAASVMLIVSLTTLIALPRLGYIVNQLAITKQHPELRETEVYYQVLITTVMSEANSIFATMPELEKEIKTDLQELEVIGRDLRDDLKENIDNREVVEALIRNYRIRIRMLEDLLAELPGKTPISLNRNLNEL